MTHTTEFSDLVQCVPNVRQSREIDHQFRAILKTSINRVKFNVK